MIFCLLPAPAGAKADESAGVAEGKKLFEAHCGVCHNLALPRSQHLDRRTWRWVLDDMVGKFGLTWLEPPQLERILDYLAAHHGPERR